MHWETKLNGTFVPFNYVKKSVTILEGVMASRPEMRNILGSAIALLMHPVKSGLIGGPDSTAIIGHAPGATVAPGTHAGIEYKAKYERGHDTQKDQQILCQENIERHGGVYILVESVDQGIADLKKYAGPGEKK
jgi:hypothetical protein